MDEQEILRILPDVLDSAVNDRIAVKWRRFGSRYIEGAARPHSDWDFLILMDTDDRGQRIPDHIQLVRDEFVMTTDPEYEAADFETYRNRVEQNNPHLDLGFILNGPRSGRVNLVFTWDWLHYEKTSRAQDLAEEFCIKDKTHRIRLFEAIRDSDWDPRLGEMLWE